MSFGQFVLMSIMLLDFINGQNTHKRQRRYLLFTSDTQYGIFAAISIPLPSPDSLVSVSWSFEVNYYNVANASYFEPLFDDVVTISRSREKRSVSGPENLLSRSRIYTFIESMLEKDGHPGRSCLLRAICENATSHSLHNGLIGDLLHFILTPSTSMSEDEMDDCYYKAEYFGLENQCGIYAHECPTSPLTYISLLYEESSQLFKI